MGNFKIGDKVIAMTNPANKQSQPRVKGNIYIVERVSYCAGCGTQRINIGCKIENTSNNNIKCECNFRQPHNNLHWTASKYFSKLDENALQEAVKEENYELASLIRDSLCHT
jgi:protein-arginine kinase activator protein McsA